MMEHKDEQGTVTCTGWVGDLQGPGERCGQPAVVVSTDRESALCFECQTWLSFGRRATSPIKMLTGGAL